MRRLNRGFSLLELLVAFSIMAVSLGLLYRMMGSSINSVNSSEQYQRAIVLADSLLSAKTSVDLGGWNESGESAGFRWSVNSAPYMTAIGSSIPNALPLIKINLTIQWRDVDHDRQLEISSLRPQRKPLIAGGVK